MFSDKFLDHFEHPRHAGELPAPAVTIEVSNPACGDVMRLAALVENDRVSEVRYQVRGCTASIAAGSALTELMQGQALDAIKRLKASQIEDALGGLADASKHAGILCIDAVKALLRKLPPDR